ncbi:MAG: hypothetical protein IJ877_03270 [Candidatus Gastranaerophilales bacterium]|nr:hypothetical protein [Candidatus Gastranaerophilales bacterium]
MEINANVSNTVAASISKLNLNTARRAFEAQKPEQEENIPEEKEIQPIDEPVKNLGVDVEDIQKYAKYMGENLSIDDINYGLMYGRSVIADYSI